MRPIVAMWPLRSSFLTASSTGLSSGGYAGPHCAGALPDLLSGYQSVTDENARKKFEQAWGCLLPLKPGITEVEIFYAANAVEIKGMYIFGENPIVADPDANHV